MPDFPVVYWGATEATFLPRGAILPADAAIYAALVFALFEGKFVVADIVGRGWCIPGGHLHSGETPEQAVRRETREEAGAALGDLRLLGHYRLTDTTTGDIQFVPTFVAQATTFAALPTDTESRGVRLLTLEELPAHYFTWDPLMAVLFPYALGASGNN